MDNFLDHLRGVLWVVVPMVVFIGYMVWVFWPTRKHKKMIEDRARIIFHEDEDDGDDAQRNRNEDT